jgi:hypothetical protein
MRNRKHWSIALTYYPDDKRKSIRKYYEDYREEHGVPARCDNPDCQFHTSPLIWNGKPFSLILDHVDGCSRNNKPGNLRYLCPLCDSQNLHTKGGGNRGRVRDVTSTGYMVRNEETGGDNAVVFLGSTLVISDRVHATVVAQDGTERHI